MRGIVTNSSAEAKSLVCQPAPRISGSSDLPTSGSASMTKTVDLVLDIEEIDRETVPLKIIFIPPMYGSLKPPPRSCRSPHRAMHPRWTAAAPSLDRMARHYRHRYSRHFRAASVGVLRGPASNHAER